MFKINPAPTFPAVIRIPVPGGETQELPVVFKHKGKKALAEFNDAMQKAAQEQDQAKGQKDEADLLFGVVDSWEADEPFNRKNFDALLDQYVPASTAIYVAYLDALIGAKRGN